ncbi:type VII secretion-associated serine protease mycosin [Streptomyces sp. NRRL S-87]|uniref:type VII secretion-associated serine protease mycosin n=1 Tax=Streptomyces sp. NRRL S-87 TaxID=1463920 RepID=UPI000A77E3DC|nr:type VII secretion-associated serine protease mycosin [Streptomyces sp. NRRL S-87]
MQWHLDVMQAEEMWQTSTGKGITVAVIDSGVGHVPELDGQVLRGKDLAVGVKGDERTDYGGHGSGIASVIAGTGRSAGADGAFGLAPGVKILPIRVPHEMRDDKTYPSHSEAIRFAADSDARVINISLGLAYADPAIAEAVKYAVSKNKLIFASVGNTGFGRNLPEYPGATPGVVGVAAIGRDAKATDESQHGPQVDLAAPGEDIVHACIKATGLCKSHGTSDATALASASAALIWAAHPTWTNNQVLRVMLNTAGKPRDGVKRNDYIGYGVVRPRVALTDPGDPGPADVYPLPDLAAAQKPASGSPDPAPSGTPPAVAGPGVIDDGSGGNEPYLALGVGAAVLIAGGVTVLTVRARRRR